MDTDKVRFVPRGVAFAAALHRLLVLSSRLDDRNSIHSRREMDPCRIGC
jgi:hypothetical protein